MSSPKPTVLFVCVHNAGRSQMAAGFMNALGAGRVQVLSAGSAPKDSINPPYKLCKKLELIFPITRQKF